MPAFFAPLATAGLRAGATFVVKKVIQKGATKAAQKLPQTLGGTAAGAATRGAVARSGPSIWSQAARAASAVRRNPTAAQRKALEILKRKASGLIQRELSRQALVKRARELMLGKISQEVLGFNVFDPTGALAKALVQEIEERLRKRLDSADHPPEVAVVGSLVSCPLHGLTQIASGAGIMQIGGKQVGSVGDMTECGAVILSGARGALVGGRQFARVGDITSHGGMVLSGESSCGVL